MSDILVVLQPAATPRKANAIRFRETQRPGRLRSNIWSFIRCCYLSYVVFPRKADPSSVRIQFRPPEFTSTETNLVRAKRKRPSRRRAPPDVLPGPRAARLLEWWRAARH